MPNMPSQKFSRFVFVLLSVGAIVGMGNYWRILQLSQQYKGAFLIAYIISVLFIGLPLLLLEFGSGKKYKDMLNLFSKSKYMKNFGWFVFATALLISVYYSILLAWNIIYFITSIGAPWKSNPLAYFANNVLQLNPDVAITSEFAFPVLVALAIGWLLAYFLMGSKAGAVGRSFSVLLPVSVVLIIIFFIKSLTISGSISGVLHFLSISLEELYSLALWKDAFLQALLTTGLGAGIYIAFSSNTKQVVFKDTLIVLLSKIIFTLLIGLMIFSTLGVLADAGEKEIGSLNVSPLGSAHILFPEALSLSSNTTLFGLIVFFSFSSLAMLALLSLVFAMSYSLSRKLKLSQRKSSGIVCLGGFVLGIIFTTKSGFYFVDVLEHFVYIYSVLVIIAVESVLIGWLVKADILSMGKAFWKTGLWKAFTRFIIPIVVVLLLVLLIRLEWLSPYKGYPLWLLTLGWALVVVPLAAVFVLSRKK